MAFDFFISLKTMYLAFIKDFQISISCVITTAQLVKASV
jgi:hypothetical protein